MNKNIYLRLVFGLIVLIGFAVIARNGCRYSDEMQSPKQQVISEALDDRLSPVTGKRVINPESKSSNQVYSKQDTRDSSAYQQRILSLWQCPIDFYGKVVDENSTPIEGAYVTFTWSEKPELTGSGNTANSLSDSNGLFSLVGKKGPNLTVRVGKDGYYTSNTNRIGFSYDLGLESFSPDPQNPIVFQLRKKGNGEASLIHVAGVGWA